jgi:hypothetical protein
VSTRSYEDAVDAARDLLTGEIEREFGRHLTLEQIIAIDRAIDRYRAMIERLLQEGRLQ